MDDDDEATPCEVCGKPVLYGSRHHQCGARLRDAGFDLADDLDRPDRGCDCPKCAAFYAEARNGLDTDRPGSNEKAFESGWRAAAKWANREDLIADIGSPAYERDADGVQEVPRG